jgi:hypothetical protein
MVAVLGMLACLMTAGLIPPLVIAVVVVRAGNVRSGQDRQ